MQLQSAPVITPSENFNPLMQMMTGYWVSQAIYSAAKLGIPDFLKNQPTCAADIARQLDANEDFVYRLMRTLGALGILIEDDKKIFRLTPMGEMLCSDVPNSMRAIALMLGEEHYHAWGKLSEGLLSGKTPFEITYSDNCFEYFKKHPQAGEVFNDAMTAFVKNEISAVASAYDFGQFELLVDVGGGHGRLLATILKQNPKLSGIAFDLPHVIDGALSHFKEEGVATRAQASAGDFFSSVPEHADAYILSHIIHDWNDELATKILVNIHKAMRPNGKLLLAETVITPGGQSPLAPLMDLNMLVMTVGGRERSEEEYGKLLKSAGFKLIKIFPLTATVSIIEAQ
jgi:hypothetical protein